MAQLVAIDQAQLTQLLGIVNDDDEPSRYYWLDLSPDSSSTQISIVSKQRVHTVSINILPNSAFS